MSKIVEYVKGSYDELVHKVSWPTMSELSNSTVVVFVASLIIAFIIFLMDMAVGVHPTYQLDMLDGIELLIYEISKKLRNSNHSERVKYARYFEDMIDQKAEHFEEALQRILFLESTLLANRPYCKWSWQIE